jgi:hypothetical protein
MFLRNEGILLVILGEVGPIGQVRGSVLVSENRRIDPDRHGK